MTLADIDREERRCARDAAYRAGEDVLPHPESCWCRACVTDEVRTSQSQGAG